jgi:L-lactate utilization protein LutC
MEWTKLANDETIAKTSKALKDRGIDVIVVKNKEDAKKKVLEMIPQGSEVMQVSSTTMDEIGISKEIENGNYNSLRKMIMAVNDEAARLELRKKSSSPEYGLGSVHAVTEDGQVVIASRSGSQIPIYAYGATNLIWVVGTQKIVKNLDHAFKRIYEHSLVLEGERIGKVYGKPGSSIDKILIVEKERPGRITLIFVKEQLGF